MPGVKGVVFPGLPGTTMRSTFEEKTMTMTTLTKTEEKSNQAAANAANAAIETFTTAKAEVQAKEAAANAANEAIETLKTLKECTTATVQAKEAARTAANAANAAIEAYNAQALLSAYEKRSSLAGGIGTLVGAGAGVTTAVLVGRRLGFEPSAIAPLVGGGAVVGGAAGGLGGLGVNAMLEWRAKNKK